MNVVYVVVVELLTAHVTVTETYSMNVAFVAVQVLLMVHVTVTETY